jgi:hypothetical protein
MKKTSFSIFLIYVLAIFNIQPANAITNGAKAAEGIALKVFSSRGECTGVIWESYIVITAAHCLIDSSGVLASGIRVGAYVNGDWEYSDAAGVKVPKDYSGAQKFLGGQSSYGDIAFIILTSKLWAYPLFPNFRLATVSDWEIYSQSPTWLEVIGYGFTGDSGTEKPTSAPVSAIFNINVNSSAGSGKDWGALNSSTSALCHGDSGGPVIYYREAEKTIILVGVYTAATGLQDATNCGTMQFGVSTSTFTKLSSYAGLATSALKTESRYRPSALALDMAFEKLGEYRTNISDLSDFEEQIPPATKKRLFTNNKNIITFQKLVDDYETKINTYEETLKQTMDFVFINSGVLEANTPEISGSIETTLKKYETKINAIAIKIHKTLPLFVCSNDVLIKDFPASKKCPKGYEKVELPQPFGAW